MYKQLIIILLNILAIHHSFAEPISIQSDCLSYNHKTGMMIHQGHVLVKGPDKSLKAHRLCIYKESNSHQFSKIIAQGQPLQPATFRGKAKSHHPIIDAQAQTIYYYPKTQQLILEGDARLIKDQDSFKSPRIHFDLSTSQIKATKNEQQRPTLIFHNPPQKIPSQIPHE